MNKNPIIAFLLAFFPGGGLMYIGKVMRGLFYTAAVIGIPALSLAATMVSGFQGFLIFALVGLLLYIVNFADTAVTASKLYNRTAAAEEGTAPGKTPDQERFFTIVLSFIPGLGHFQLGLVYRGMTMLASFLGLGAMILFVTLISHRSEFLVFMAALPVIWLLSFFDVLKLLDLKQKGETLVDQSIFEDLQNRNSEGKKSKTVASMLSIIPGAGHLYLGLQKRGIQLMAAFLLSIYILDVLRLGILLFVVPLIWFFSFFDGLQQASKADSGELEDEPIIEYFANHQKWIGIGLVALGLYYLLVNIFLPAAEKYLRSLYNIEISYYFYNYFQTAIICLLLIGGGIKLMSGKKHGLEEQEETE